MGDFERILVPTDFEESASRALEIAVDLQAKWGSALTLLHTYELPIHTFDGEIPIPVDQWKIIEDSAEKALAQAMEPLRKRVPTAVGVLRAGKAWEMILSVAKETNATLIIMGTHGRRGIRHLLLGSVAERVVRLSPVPVLTVRAPSA